MKSSTELDLPWRHEIDLELSSRRVELSFTVPEGSTWLEIRLTAVRPLLACAHVYNGAGRFIGEVSFWNQTTSAPVYFGNRGHTLNALVHPLEAGVYRIVCNVPFHSADSHGHTVGNNRLKGSVTGGPAESEPLLDDRSDLSLQMQVVVDPDGHIQSATAPFDTRPRYYRGDLHGHTTYSDGKLTNEQAWSLIDERGLDFMAITEHNAISFGQPAHRALHVPAFELTLPSGHLNIFGMRRISAIPETWDRLMRVREEAGRPNMAEILQNLREPGALVSVNHMFLSPWEFTATGVPIDKIDTIEIICDPTYPDSPLANDKAVAFIDYLWNQGCRVYAVGGSDSHNAPDDWYEGADGPSIYGDPSTWVCAQGLSVEQLLSALRRGHAYVARHVVLDITIGEGKLLPGDSVSSYGGGDIDFSYRVSVGNLDRLEPGSTYTAVFIMNGKTVQRTQIDREHPEAVLPSVQSVVRRFMTSPESPLTNTGRDEAWWVRFGLLDEEGHVTAYVNPVYSGSFKTCDLEIGRLIKDFELQAGGPLE